MIDLLAILCSEPSTWLNALHIAALGLCLSNNTMGVAVLVFTCVGLTILLLWRWGEYIWNSWSELLLQQGLSPLLCIVEWCCSKSLESTKVPCHPEPSELSRSGCKWPDHASLVLRKGGKIHAKGCVLLGYSSFLWCIMKGAVVIEVEHWEEVTEIVGNEECHFFTIVTWCIEKELDDMCALQHQLQWCVPIAIKQWNAVSILGTLNDVTN